MLLNDAQAARAPAPGPGAGHPAAGDPGASHPAADQAWPLTEAQEGLWYAQQLDPSNPLFNTGHYLDIHGPLDREAFRLATARVMAEAPALSLRIHATPDGPRQWLDAEGAPALELRDLAGHTDAEAQALAQMQADLRQPVDLATGPLARQLLFALGPDRHLWYLRVHHLAADGYGMGLIERRLAQHYAHLTQGSPAGEPLGGLTEVLAEDAGYRNGEARQRDQAYWRDALGAEPQAVGLAEGAAITAHDALRAGQPLPPALMGELLALQERSSLSWPDVLTALTAAYLARHTPAQAENTVGVPFMGRLGSASARVVCTAMNVAPLRLAIDETLPLEDYLVQAARQLRQLRRHGRYRSEQLRRDLGLLGGRRRLYGPLINVLPFDAPADLAGLPATRHVLGTGPVDDLTFTFRAGAAHEPLRLELEGNPRLYEPSALAAHLQRLPLFLARALRAERLADVPTLTPAETTHWLATVNDTAHPVPDTTLWALLQSAMMAHPGACAIRAEQGELSYAELDRLSGALAARLATFGVVRGDRVAVAMPRGLALPVALVAILRAGAAYLPLDPAHPRERLAGLLRSAAPRLLLTDANAGAGTSANGLDTLHAHLAVDLAALTAAPAAASEASAGASAASAVPGAPTAPHGADGQAPRPADPAYVLYTSGSTGAPKGVVISHRAIVNRLLWMQAHYGFDAGERILQKTPATFDVSVWEFFLPLIGGATLVMAPPQAHRDPAWLARLIREQAITSLHFVPSMLSAFLDEPGTAGLRLRRVFCSGEELPAALRNRFHAQIQAELHNLYGPTEAAVDVGWWPAGPDDASQPVPIGYPVWNTALYILDEHLRPVPPGVAGRLFLAGRQLADGYLGQPALTAERFVADPFGGPGERMYDTGDLARWREDGAVVFLGRRDHQVKIRGQRLELGEIEAVLAAAPGVAQATVLAHEGLPGGPLLAAYAAALPGADDVTPDTLRQWLQDRLPDFMVPGSIQVLDALPVTANGKLDRRALPAPVLAGGAGRAPDTPTERRVAELMGAVLEHAAPLSADDDFFALGGHSLLAARLAQRLRETLGVDVSLGALFEHPTVARLAAYLDAPASGAGGFGPCIALRPGTAPALFFIHPAGGLSWCYGHLSRALAPGRGIHGLQARSLDPAQALPESLEAMAADYADRIAALQPASPYHLAGWSVGGILAQAVAVELQRRGQAVGAVALLDAYPSDCWRDQPAPPPEAVYKALLHIAGHDPDTLPDVALTREGVIGFLRRSGHALGALSDENLMGVFRSVEHTNQLVRSHRHARYDGPLLYFRAALDHANEPQLVPERWAPYARTVEVHPVASLHAHLTGPAATATIAPLLSARLARADRAAAEPIRD